MYGGSMELRDYGLPQFPDPIEAPKIVEQLNESCENEKCGCDKTFLIEVKIPMARYIGGYGIGRYKGCACCPWAGPMTLTGVRKD